jgi:hypothetical protein
MRILAEVQDQGEWSGNWRDKSESGFLCDIWGIVGFPSNIASPIFTS